MTKQQTLLVALLIVGGYVVWRFNILNLVGKTTVSGPLTVTQQINSPIFYQANSSLSAFSEVLVVVRQMSNVMRNSTSSIRTAIGPGVVVTGSVVDVSGASSEGKNKFLGTNPFLEGPMWGFLPWKTMYQKLKNGQIKQNDLLTLSTVNWPSYGFSFSTGAMIANRLKFLYD